MDTLARLLVYPFIHLFANTDTLCPPYLAQIFFFFLLWFGFRLRLVNVYYSKYCLLLIFIFCVLRIYRWLQIKQWYTEKLSQESFTQNNVENDSILE